MFTANQFVVASSSLRLMNRDNSCGHSPYVTSPLTRRWVWLLWILLAFCQAYVPQNIAYYWKLFILHYMQVLCRSRLCKAYHVYLLYLILQQQLSHLNSPKLDQSQDSDIFYVWLCLVLNHEHVISHDSVWLQFVACTILLYNRIHMEGWKLWKIADRCAPWKISNGAEILIL
jgi:hypothetical protein